MEFVEINFYAAFNETTGWGCICRDETVDVRFAAAGRLPMASDALQVETLAMLKAVDVADDIADDMGWGAWYSRLTAWF